MKTISLRKLARDAPTITEAVLVLHNRQVVGQYKPFTKDTALDFDMSEIWDHLEEVPMDDIARKAIEPEKVKPEGRGKLSKGLGDLPGEPKPTVQRDPYREFKPVPKK